MSALSPSAKLRLRGLHDLKIMRAATNNPAFNELVSRKYATRRDATGGRPPEAPLRSDFAITDFGTMVSLIMFSGENVDV